MVLKINRFDKVEKKAKMENYTVAFPKGND